MRAQEFLRQIADMLDQKEGGAKPQADVKPNRAVLTPVPKPEEPECGCGGHDDDSAPEMNVDTMVPPLQQKIELLKKAVGVDSIFDTDEEPDELDVIRSLAGMNPGAAAAFTAGEDNDIVG
jgi:hypothetical protein